MSQQAPKDLQMPVVSVVNGQIEYKDPQGQPKTFVFQCNPASVTRSRTIQRTETRAGNTAEGTTTRPGPAGRKFTHKPTPWRFESLELWFDASVPYTTSGSVNAEGVTVASNLDAIAAALDHLEAISEPGSPSNQNDSQSGSPPAPSPPQVTLRLGKRVWKGYVNSVSILEKDFTWDLVPKQVKVTLGLELEVSRQDLDRNRPGGKK